MPKNRSTGRLYNVPVCDARNHGARCVPGCDAGNQGGRMPRKRLRPGWQVRNYTYACLIVGEPPQPLWDTARAMQTLWNRLIDLHEAMRAGWTDDSPAQAVKAQAYKDLLGAQGHVYLACRDEGERLGLSAWQ